MSSGSEKLNLQLLDADVRARNLFGFLTLTAMGKSILQLASHALAHRAMEILSTSGSLFSTLEFHTRTIAKIIMDELQKNKVHWEYTSMILFLFLIIKHASFKLPALCASNVKT